MSTEKKPLKTKESRNDSRSKPGNKLKEAMKASRKLNFSDLQQLALYINDTLQVKKQKQIDDLEKELRQLKGN